MKVYYIGKEKPMIRIVRESLKDYGFNVGDEIEVKMKKGEIRIKKISPLQTHTKVNRLMSS